MKKTKTKTCACEEGPGQYWTCCVCRNWNLQQRTKCKSCGHQRGADREATP